MITRGALLFCLVVGCVGALLAVMAADGSSSTGVLADATVPAPTIPGGLYVPVVFHESTPTPTPEPTPTPLPTPDPRIAVSNTQWRIVDTRDRLRPYVYAQIRNLTQQTIRIDSVTAYFLDAEGRAFYFVTESPGVPIWVLNPGMDTPAWVGTGYRCGSVGRVPDLPMEPTDVRVVAAWHATDEEVTDLSVTVERVERECAGYGCDTWTFSAVGYVANQTPRTVPEPKVVLYGRCEPSRHPHDQRPGFIVASSLLPGSMVGFRQAFHYCWWGECDCAVPNARAVDLPLMPTSGAILWSSEIPEQQQRFSVEFTAGPRSENTDAVIGLSQGAATGLTDLGPIVRFNPSGYIDARNGQEYEADVMIPYDPTNSYSFRMVINVPHHTYTVDVLCAPDDVRTLATDYAFRTEQSQVSSLDHWAWWSSPGSLYMCDLQVLPVDTE